MNQIIRVKSEGFDDRFYHLDDIYAPSVTYVLGVTYPTSPHLMKWIGEMGYEESQAIKTKAGEEGSAVHQAIDVMIQGGSVHRDEFNYKEKKCLMAFLDFWKTEAPIVVSCESMFIQKEMCYGGTIDLVARLKRDNYKSLWCIDWKTSRSLHEYHKIQIKAYQHATMAERAALVHLGNTTKAGWSFCEVDDPKYFEMWKHCLNMFKIMKPDAKPIWEEFPEIFTLNSNQDVQEQTQVNA